MKGKILVTGGAGYIGSHTVVKLLEAGFPVVVFDNLSNSHPAVINRIQKLTGKSFEFIVGDIRDRISVRKVFQKHSIGAVIHFAGLKSICESEAEPLKYYDNNVCGSIVLFDETLKANVNIIVFSSSATVYGDPGYVQYRENTPLIPINVYGRTKLMVENLLRDIKKSRPKLRAAILRYFNSVGAHVSGQIGENPLGPPNNLMPFISQVAVGKRKQLLVFGNDYPTPDGTSLRDYLHVEDLAIGHLAALNVLNKENSIITVNLGAGKSHSVFEIIKTFEKISGKNIPYEIVERRSGEVAAYYADPSLAKIILNWEAKYNIDRICEDTWRWQKKNPEGYSYE